MKYPMHKKYILSIILMQLSILCFPDSNPNIKSITNALTNKGYENLCVYTSDDTIYIAYENRKYRWESMALVEIIQAVIPYSENSKELSIVIQLRGIPIIQVLLNINKINDYTSGKILMEEFRESIHASYIINNFKQRIKNNPQNNSSFNKFDVVIHPHIRAQFGDYNNPVKLQLNIAPSVNVSLWKGMKLTTQVILPLYNEFEEEGDYIRPGLLTINQLIQLPLNTFASINIGHFTNERYGINLDLKKFFLQGKLSIGGNIGYTGYASMLRGSWTYSEINLVSWFTNFAYRNAKYDLTIQFGYGSFIANDQGWRFDMYRQFGEINIGFYGMKTDGVINGGFNFIIPIPPRKNPTKRMVRIRPASYFAWEYRAKAHPEHGNVYDTGSELFKTSMYFNPDYIKNNIIQQLYN